VSHVLEVPVERGGWILLELSPTDLPADLELAAARSGTPLVRARYALEQAWDGLRPAITTIHEQLSSLGPDSTTVSFGITLGTETGAVVAKGSATAHFTVTMTWQLGDADRSARTEVPGVPRSTTGHRDHGG
jgi:hypothetical protein